MNLLILEKKERRSKKIFKKILINLGKYLIGILVKVKNIYQTFSIKQI